MTRTLALELAFLTRKIILYQFCTKAFLDATSLEMKKRKRKVFFFDSRKDLLLKFLELKNKLLFNGGI